MRKVIILLAIAVFLIPMVCGASHPGIREVREKYESSLFEIGGVSGVSVDEVEGEIIVYIEKLEVKEKVPKKLNNFPVRCEVIGRIEALATATETVQTYQSSTTYSRTGRQRPIFGGISVGNAKAPGSAGTLGLVTDDGYVLSNAHVLAMDTNAKIVKVGTATWQPGGYDGGTNADKIGELYKYIPIKFYSYRANNYADAAISTITVSEAVPENKGEVLNETNTGFYTINATTEVSKGETVRKSGRTTGVTTNTVRDTSATVKVYYTNTRWAIFKDQILVEQPFSKGGDSGSAVDKGGEFVGLVFAGSEGVTVVCKAKYIVSGLGIGI